MNAQPQNLDIPVIAVDGGAAEGKSTVCNLVADDLGFHRLDSGLLYRGVGMRARDLSATTSEQMGEIARSLELAIEGGKVYLHGQEVTVEIGDDQTSALAKAVSKIPEVRAGLLEFQLRMRKLPGLVADGRDQCFVFETPHRFFLLTDFEERAHRRVKQFEARQKPAVFETILADIKRRDHEDSTRAISPMKPHPDAVVINTKGHGVRQVADMILAAYSVRKQ